MVSCIALKQSSKSGLKITEKNACLTVECNSRLSYFDEAN